MRSEGEGAAGRIGLVGVGTMGAPMARCLARAGHPLTVFDINHAVAEMLAAEVGGRAAASLPELGRQCGVVITMLPNAEIVRSAVLGSAGSEGLVAGLSSGSIVVDMSSSFPLATRALGAELVDKGIVLVDGPVSGGVRKAIDGKLAIMLGGDDDTAMNRVEPILGAMGTVFRTGGLGSGHATKALNNYVSAAGLVAACEAVIAGRAFGLDPERMVDVINASTGRNNSTENKIKPFVLTGDFAKAGFALDLMAKDLKAAADLCDELGLPLSGIAEARDLWSNASRSLGKGADHTEIYRFLDEERQSRAASTGRAAPA